MFQCYSELVDSVKGSQRVELVATATEASDDDVAAVSQIWTETTSYLLERKEMSEEAWSMVRCVNDYNCVHVQS